MSKEGSSDEGARDAGGAEAGKKDANADLYEGKGSKKIVRLITVVAYMFSVSFVAIVLSAYYLFLWEPPNPRLLKRPIHLSGEPEVQFLLGDPLPVVTNLSTGPFLAPNKFTSRMSDDTFNPNDRITRSKSMNESLLLLRQSMIEYQRKMRKESGHDQLRHDSTRPVSHDGGWSNLTKESNEGSARFATLANVVEGGTLSSNISDQGGRTDSASLGFNYTDEGNYERSTTNANDDVFESSRTLNHSVADSQGKGEEYIPRSLQEILETVRETSENDAKTERIVENAEATRDSPLNVFSGKFPSATEITALINKSEVVMTARDKEDPDVQGARDNARADGLLISNRSSINSSRNSKLADRLELNPSFQTFTNIAMNFKETQIEKITTRPVTGEKEQNRETETTTTTTTTTTGLVIPRKNLLTMLTGSTTMSSNVMTLTSSDSTVNPNMDNNQERVTNASPKSD